MWYFLLSCFVYIGFTYFIGLIFASCFLGTMESINKSFSKSDIADDSKMQTDSLTLSSDETFDSESKKEKCEDGFPNHDGIREDQAATTVPLVQDLAAKDTDKSNSEFKLDSLVFSLGDLRSIEMELTSCEKVSLAFMYFDDIDICLKYCSKFSGRFKYNGFIKYSRNIIPEKRSAVLIECLYMLKNYYLLEKFGIDKYTAKNIFCKLSNINPERLLLYKICDSLNRNDTKRVMNAIETIPDENYLEIFFLKLTEPDQWTKVSKILHEIDGIQSFIADFDKLVDSKQRVNIANLPILPIEAEKVTDRDDVYPIKDPNNVGLCIIINEFDFLPPLKTRIGSEKDVDAIENVMKTLNFEVITMQNVSQKYFAKPLFEKIDEKFKENYSVFFLVIMSHGDRGVFFTSDNKPVSIEANIFKILNYIPKLKGIPKVIIVQACQGDKFLKSDKIVTDGVEVEPSNIKTDNSPLDLRKIIGEYISDAFLVMSTVPGFKSFRQTDTGSFFIQSLCECLQKYQHYNFFDIITEVIKLVDLEIVPTKLKGLNVSQQPECRSLLKKKLYLKKI